MTGLHITDTALKAIAEEQVVRLIGLNYKDEDFTAKRWLSEFGNPYEYSIVDHKGHFGLDLGVYGVPETFVIDRNGNVVLRFAGPVTESILENRIRPAIEAASAE